MAISILSSRQKSNDGHYDQSVNDEQLSPPAGQLSFLEKLPAEIIQDIASYLSAPDLACLGATCRTLVDHASNDFIWANLVNERLPAPIKSPGPFGSFRRLYLAYHPCWFIPQHKIWFADTEHTGMLIIARYDNGRGMIEAHPVVAERGTAGFQSWASNPEVIIQSFEPSVHLALDNPVLSLKDPNPSSQIAPIQSLHYMPEERRMNMASDARHIYTSLSFCSEFSPRGPFSKPNVLWPPRTIPSKARTVRDLRNSPPPIVKLPSELSESFFRLRRWGNPWANPELQLPPVPKKASLTYSTLDPVLYTPSVEKPYQGIWVGDYEAHGCEFLLVLQKEITDLAHDNEKEAKVIDAQDEVEHDSQEDIGQRGLLQAVKLTGDSNVPRGEFSFIAEDIGSRGLISVAMDEPFVGARIVRCRGHVAGLGFLDDTYIDSQLILISPDHMALYWKQIGHVSYYRRVNIDDILHS
ncbi:Protein of unknown function DUF3506 [Penicillium concentricum]|uniref:F-box domain-containing protein n=1 Tax=Penicillium concentricum TaxID=293559 RepID=A0A9W9SWG2_9EURO|nr:Protein of unknown function DUF3506 [Penicillium concentricum]KAJ5385049.1 Protein of unknown function DUF3506 [Penicillium concentricum]